MLSPYAARITGWGSAFPKKALTNDEISQRVETSDEWIRERTGIRERRISDPLDSSEFNSSLGLAAARRALEMSHKAPEDIDLLIYATSSPDQPLPATACFLQAKLGATKAWALDISAACSGFVYGTSMADQFIRSGHSKTVLVVGAEVLSRLVNWEDRVSCVLFGDGAGAAIIERTQNDNPNRILSTHLGSDGSLAHLIQIPCGGTNTPVDGKVLVEKTNKIHVQGREVFKEAVRTLAEYATMALEANGLTVADLDWFAPHQANLRIMDAVADRLGIPKNKVLCNIERYGNTSAASIPAVINEAVRDGRIKPGQLVLMDSFGGGLTYGSALFRF